MRKESERQKKKNTTNLFSDTQRTTPPSQEASRRSSHQVEPAAPGEKTARSRCDYVEQERTENKNAPRKGELCGCLHYILCGQTEKDSPPPPPKTQNAKKGNTAFHGNKLKKRREIYPRITSPLQKREEKEGRGKRSRSRVAKAWTQAVFL